MSGADNKATLARMAGQIADFFKSYPEDQAVASIASHINKFWNWRMREEFVTSFQSDDPALAPLVVKVIPLIKRKTP
jgi:formate dehydrogenase subunit delta